MMTTIRNLRVHLLFTAVHATSAAGQLQGCSVATIVAKSRESTMTDPHTSRPMPEPPEKHVPLAIKYPFPPHSRTFIVWWFATMAIGCLAYAALGGVPWLLEVIKYVAIGGLLFSAAFCYLWWFITTPWWGH